MPLKLMNSYKMQKVKVLEMTNHVVRRRKKLNLSKH
jgi:hypothetical protein